VILSIGKLDMPRGVPSKAASKPVKKTSVAVLRQDAPHTISADEARLLIELIESEAAKLSTEDNRVLHNAGKRIAELVARQTAKKSGTKKGAASTRSAKSVTKRSRTTSGK
jgi:hypothetical protein